MLEHILHRNNLNAAYLKVTKNKGSHGVDGVSTSELKTQISEEWDTIYDIFMRVRINRLPSVELKSRNRTEVNGS